MPHSPNLSILTFHNYGKSKPWLCLWQNWDRNIFVISGWLSLKYLRHLIYLVGSLWDIGNIWDILFCWLFAVSAVAGRLCLQSFNLTLPPYHHYRHLYWTTRHHHFYHLYWTMVGLPYHLYRHLYRTIEVLPYNN